MNQPQQVVGEIIFNSPMPEVPEEFISVDLIAERKQKEFMKLMKEESEEECLK